MDSQGGSMVPVPLNTTEEIRRIVREEAHYLKKFLQFLFNFCGDSFPIEDLIFCQFCIDFQISYVYYLRQIN